MRSLWVTFLLIATLGSIYPFNFTAINVDAAAVLFFLESCCKRLGRGDILGNVLLFVPVGFTGMLGVQLDRSIRSRMLFVFFTGVLVALLLQLLQFYLPSRDENLQDVAWNALGLMVGCVFAILLARSVGNASLRVSSVSLVPLTLVSAWLSYRLMPFVPSLDLQGMKNSLKPLLLNPQISIGGVAHDVAAWLVVAYLLQHAQRRDGTDLQRWLPALMAVVFSLEVLIVNNVLTASNVVGALIALLLWISVLRERHNQAGALIVVVLGALVVSGLSPFVPRDVPASFAWLPFRGFLGGSMYINALSAADKVFLYGSLVYLLWRTALNRMAGLAVGVSVVLAIEWLQRYVIGHTPELTDPVLVLLAAGAIVSLERQDERLPRSGKRRRPGRGSRAPAANAERVSPAANLKASSVWVRQTVNLRDEQKAFLAVLATEMGASVSGAIRKILQSFMDEFGGNEDFSAGPITGGGSVSETGVFVNADAAPGWSTEVVHLRRAQAHYVETVATAAGISTSRVVRKIVQRFIDELDASARKD